MGNHSEYIHHTAVDGSNTYGSMYGTFPRRNRVGGIYSESTSCGSRSSQAYINTAYTRHNHS